MTRAGDFTKPVKRAALRRSGRLCEATGDWYGLPHGARCNAPLSFGVEFDHIDQEANSHDGSLENCAAVCPRCHRFKTDHIDTPKAAKTLRQQDKALGITRNKKPWPKRLNPWGKKSFQNHNINGREF